MSIHVAVVGMCRWMLLERDWQVGARGFQAEATGICRWWSWWSLRCASDAAGRQRTQCEGTPELCSCLSAPDTWQYRLFQQPQAQSRKAQCCCRTLHRPARPKPHPCLMLALCQVYERSQQYRTCGAGVSVSANGLKSIRAVSPELHAQFQARAEHFDSMEQLDQHGRVPLIQALAALQPRLWPSDLQDILPYSGFSMSSEPPRSWCGTLLGPWHVWQICFDSTFSKLCYVVSFGYTRSLF